MSHNSSRLLFFGEFLLVGLMLIVGYLYFTSPSGGIQSGKPDRAASQVAAVPSPSIPDQGATETLAQISPAPEQYSSVPSYEALAMALQTGDPVQRQKKVDDLVSQWAETDPKAALRWASTLTEDLSGGAIEAVFDGAARHPALALKFGRELLADDSADGNPHGLMLVGSLTRNGNYSTALQLAGEAPSDIRASWTTAIFTGWALTKPTDALKALSGMTDPTMREPAFNALVDSWASDKAADLAAYSTTLPPGSERNHALNSAMDKWSLQNPAAASEWLNSLPPSAELDQGIAWIVTRTDGANRTPDVAVGWAESISDPALRLSSVAHVVQEWAASNPSAARQYVQSASWPTNDQRAVLLESLSPKP